jgi:uncharacterized protein (DUF952 family)
MANIFHIISQDEWDKAQKHGVYSPDSLNKEGFIHCSHTDQICDVANNLYRGHKSLLLLRIQEPDIKPEVKHEPPLEAPFSGILFPHIYGDLNLDAVDKVFDFPVGDDGKFSLPSSLLE